MLAKPYPDWFWGLLREVLTGGWGGIRTPNAHLRKSHKLPVLYSLYTGFLQVLPKFPPPPITNQKKFLLFGKILKFLQGGVVFKASAIFQLLFY
jgi:hypothetical protein